MGGGNELYLCTYEIAGSNAATPNLDLISELAIRLGDDFNELVHTMNLDGSVSIFAQDVSGESGVYTVQADDIRTRSIIWEGGQSLPGTEGGSPYRELAESVGTLVLITVLLAIYHERVQRLVSGKKKPRPARKLDDFEEEEPETSGVSEEGKKRAEMERRAQSVTMLAEEFIANPTEIELGDIIDLGIDVIYLKKHGAISNRDSTRANVERLMKAGAIDRLEGNWNPNTSETMEQIFGNGLESTSNPVRGWVVDYFQRQRAVIDAATDDQDELVRSYNSEVSRLHKHLRMFSNIVTPIPLAKYNNQEVSRQVTLHFGAFINSTGDVHINNSVINGASTNALETLLKGNAKKKDRTPMQHAAGELSLIMASALVADGNFKNINAALARSSKRMEFIEGDSVAGEKIVFTYTLSDRSKVWVEVDLISDEVKILENVDILTVNTALLANEIFSAVSDSEVEAINKVEAGEAAIDKAVRSIIMALENGVELREEQAIFHELSSAIEPYLAYSWFRSAVVNRIKEYLESHHEAIVLSDTYQKDQGFDFAKVAKIAANKLFIYLQPAQSLLEISSQIYNESFTPEMQNLAGQFEILPQTAAKARIENKGYGMRVGFIGVRAENSRVKLIIIVAPGHRGE